MSREVFIFRVEQTDYSSVCRMVQFESLMFYLLFILSIEKSKDDPLDWSRLDVSGVYGTSSRVGKTTGLAVVCGPLSVAT